MRYLVFLIALLATTANAQLKETSRQELPHTNVLGDYNAGFENGLARWTATTPANVTKDTSTPLVGKASAIFDATAASENFDAFDVTVPEGLHGRPCVLSFLYEFSGTGGHYTFEVFDGTNSITDPLDITNTTGDPTISQVGFTCPTSGTISARISSTDAGATAIELDQFWLGSDYRRGEASQATLHGAATFASNASCGWSVSGASFGDLPADADCSISTLIGNAEDPGNDQPEVRFTNLSPGFYVLTVPVIRFNQSAEGDSCGYRLSDGSTNFSGVRTGSQTTSSSVLEAVFEITAFEASKTFIIQGKETGSCALSLNDTDYTRPMTWRLVRYPITTTDTVNLETQGARAHVYHSNSTCNWGNTTSTSYTQATGDAGCTLETDFNKGYTIATTADGTGSTTGITVTPPYLGTHKVCANFALLGASTNAFCAAQLYDGTNSLAEVEQRNGDDAGAPPHRICAYPVWTSFTSMDIDLRLKCSAGTFDTVSSTARGAIEWQIEPYTQNFPQAVALTARTETKALDNDFTGGTVRITRIGDNVTISLSALTASHASLSTATTTSGFIPTWARPPVNNMRNIYNLSSSAVYRAEVDTDGTLSTTYVDWSGSTTNLTSAGVINISYAVEP